MLCRPSMILQRTIHLLGISLATYGQVLTLPRTIALKIQPQPTSISPCIRLFSSMSSTDNTDVNEHSDRTNHSKRTIRMLALHGSEGNAENFAQRLEPWQSAALDEHEISLEITTITAPVPKGRGFAWWSMPPFVRSYNATTYEHFGESEQLVLQQLEEKGPFDIVMGFSQGAILSTSLLALKTVAQQHARLGFILVGGAWPNPYTQQLESLGTVSESSENTTIFQNNPVLIVAGTEDTINPLEQSVRVQKALEAGGCPVTLLTFDGGHVVPREDAILNDILQWIQEKVVVGSQGE